MTWSCDAKLLLRHHLTLRTKKLELNMPDSMSTVSIERYTSQGSRIHEGTEEKDSKPARGSVQHSDCTLDFHHLKRGDCPNTIMKTHASTYALNMMCFNNKLSFLSLVSSSMLIRRECDWYDNMSIMGVVRLKFLFVT